MPRQLLPKSPASPQSSRDGKKGGTFFVCCFRFSQTMMVLLGMTYTIMVLVPLLKHQSDLLKAPRSSLLSSQAMLEGWSRNLFNSTSEQSCSGMSRSATVPIKIEPKNRTITLVHIGKAGMFVDYSRVFMFIMTEIDLLTSYLQVVSVFVA